MNKKQQVVETARDLFSKYGYRISMDEIARESKVTKRTIYSYFKDKDELIKYFLYEELENINNILNVIDSSDVPFSTKINEMMNSALDYQVNSKLLKGFEMESKYSNECLDIFNNSVVSFIKERIERAIEQGYVKECDTELTAFIIYKIYVAIKFEWKGNIDRQKFSSHVIDLLTNGILKQGDD